MVRVAADYCLLLSVGDSDNLALVRVELQSASHFCKLSMSFCNLSGSAVALMFQYRRQSSANRCAVEDTWSGRSLV